ncbi:unnamed protein product [Effrenium voratum]|nr:unnamed protein product [Effrenium voratum]
MSTPFVYKCYCEAVELVVEGPPMFTAHCHCKGCRAWSGCAFRTVAMVPQPQVKITKGEGSILSQRKAEGLPNHHWCGECGTRIGNKVDSLGAWGLEAALVAGLLEAFPPKMDINCESLPTWSKPQTETQFPTFPPRPS